VIVPDLNLLVYAYNADAQLHDEARVWWERLMNGRDPVGIPWVVSCGFVRLMTHPRVLEVPVDPKLAIDHVSSWFECSHVRVVNPSPRHLIVLKGLLGSIGVGGNLVTDAHIAAIAIEHQAEVHSNDADFARFPGLNWSNPLGGAIR
jgi:toxin-antitoxin system PIN domain toxin